LVAAVCGRLEFMPQATVLYRQHGENRVGAPGLGIGQAIRTGLALLKGGQLAGRLVDSQRQARALLDRFAPEMPVEDRAVVEAYANLRQHGFLGRRVALMRYGFYKHGWVRNLGLFAAI
jgi:hypothetical protein